MYTNRIRMTGLSGIDTEQMVQQMMQAESMRMNKLQGRNQLLLWKQDAYRSHASQMQDFQTKFFSFTNPKTNLRSGALFRGLEAKISVKGAESKSGVEHSSSAISVRPGEGAKPGKHTIKVEQTAKGERYESDAYDKNITGVGKVDFSKMSDGDSISVSLDGTTKEIKFTGSEISEINGETDEKKRQEAISALLEKKFEDAFGKIDKGIKAKDRPQLPDGSVNTVDPEDATATNPSDRRDSKIVVGFDGDGQIILSAGDHHSLQVSDGNLKAATETGTKIDENTDFSQLSGKELNVKVGDNKTVTIDFSKFEYDDETKLADVVKDINNSLRSEGVSASVEDGEITFKNNKSDAAVSVKGSALNDLGFTEDINLDANSSLGALGLKDGTKNQVNLNENLADAFDLSGFPDEIKFEVGGKEVLVDKKVDTINSLMQKINSAGGGATIKFDETESKFVFESNETGTAAKIDFKDSKGGLLEKVFGFDDNHKEEARDAIFTYDGQKMYKNSNSFTVEGIGITITDEAINGEFEFELTGNSDDAFEAISEFVNDYNEMIGKMQDATKQTRAKAGKYSTYEPLTDEQKADMSDKEIEKWEAKAKEGLLYRDDVLNAALRDMRSLINERVELADGSYISMADIGITTTSRVSEGGKLEIDINKLRGALETRSDDVATLFTKSSDISVNDKGKSRERLSDMGVSERLNETFKKYVSGSGSEFARRAGFEGTASEKNNVLYRQLDAQGKKISRMQEQLIRKEENYFKMFSRMEAAMMQAQSQSDYLMQMMGGM